MADYPNFAGEAQFLDTASVPTPPANNLAVYSDGGVLKTKNSSGTVTTLGVDLASPSAIGSTTPNTGAFTTLSATGSIISQNGTSVAGPFEAYNTYSSGGTNFERGVLKWVSNTLKIGTEKGGTGQTRGFDLLVGGSICAFGDTAGNFFFQNIFAQSGGFIRVENGATFGGFIGGGNAANLRFSSGGATSFDCTLTRDAADTFAQRRDTNAQEFRLYGTFTSTTNYQRMTIKSVKQTLSSLSGASATTTGTFIPDGAVVVGVTTRVTTLLAGATGYTIGDGTDADRWGDITGTAVGTTSDNRDWTTGTIECFTAGGNITLTAKTSNFTAGAIEICVFYLAGEAD